MNADEITWEDLRFLLMAGRVKSLSQLASELSVDATTASRRLKALENALGIALFERTRGRLILTQQAHQLIAHLEPMELSENDFRAAVQNLKGSPEGTVCVSAPPTLARFLLAPNISKLRAVTPGVSINLVSELSKVKLERLEADIAIRMGPLIDTNDDLIAAKIGHLSYAMFSASAGDSSKSWIAYPKEFSHLPEAKWIEDKLDGMMPPLRTNDPFAMASAVASGCGQALLPTLLADSFAGIRQQGSVVLQREIWLLRRSGTLLPGAVRATYDWITKLVKTQMRG